MNNIPMDPERKNKFYFQMLLEEYEMRAWIGLGKIPNPATNRTERNLALAKISIDILEMIEEKTKNNLDDDEKQLLKNKLVNLRLNYAEEYEKQKKEEAAKSESEDKSKEQANAETVSTEEQKTDSSEEKKNKN